MSLPIEYTMISERLQSARSWAGDVTAGNRCALVVGVALHIRPEYPDMNFQNFDGANEHLRNMPFLRNFFVKAQQLNDRIECHYGIADKILSGSRLIEFAKVNPGKTPIDGVKGVIYLKDCFRTRREQLNPFGDDRSGDHIDLWDGNVLEIYKEKGRDVAVRGLMVHAKAIHLWVAR